MENKTKFAMFALLFAGLIASMGLVSAYRGDYAAPNEERHSAIEAAFESQDYDAWHALMTEDGRHPRVVDVVTKDNFETFASAREAALNGDSETAKGLREELGLNKGLNRKMQNRHAGKFGNCEHLGLKQGR